MISWEGQRNRLALLAAERLGRPVALQGPLRVELLPQPIIEADDVHLGADEAGLGIKAQTLRLKLGLLPLMLGRLEARDLVLLGADIRLPWPLPATGALRPPPWLSDFAARIEGSRVSLGEAVLENVAARLVAPGPLDAVRLEGSFTRAGAEARFQAVLGRPGYDGIGTLELRLNGQGATLLTRGALLAEGGYEGRLEASGAYLSAFLPAPALPFRVAGRVRAGEQRITAPELTVEFDGGTGRAAAEIQILPQAKLDLAVTMNRLDLDPWITTLRSPRTLPLPVVLDVAADTARWLGRDLRRFKVGIAGDGARLTLTDMAALLPGEAEIEARGATLGERIELAASFAGPDLRESLGAFGLALAAPDPARLRRFEGHARLVLEADQIQSPAFTLTLDGQSMAGAGVLRLGNRPALGLGLSANEISLDGLLADGLDWAQFSEALQGFDANLRLAVGRLHWRGLAWDELGLEAALEGGRLSLQRLAAWQGGASITATGGIGLSTLPVFNDFRLEVAAPMATALPRFLLEAVPLPAGLAQSPILLRLRGNGGPEALTFDAEVSLEDARLEANAILDISRAGIEGSLTFRHPGAARFFALAFSKAELAWMGEGSVALIARINADGPVITLPSITLVVAETRLAGVGRIELNGARPKFALTIAAEHLALPAPEPSNREPLPWAAWGGLDGTISLTAHRISVFNLPTVQEARAELVLDAGRLGVQVFEAALAGGKIEARGFLDGASQPPRLEGDFEITGASLAGPIFDLPFDLTAGQIALAGRISASGHSPAAQLSSMEGSGRLLLADGVVAGVALRDAYAGAALADPTEAEMAIKRALQGGATAVERLEGGWRLASGRLELLDMRLAGEAGVSAGITGAVDLPRRTLDIGFTLRPPLAEAPDIGLRFSGPSAAPLRFPEIAPWARWRAEQR